MAVGRYLRWRDVKNDDKSRSEIGFMREYFSICYHNMLKGGPIAMASGVCNGRLRINRPCLTCEWCQQERFQIGKMGMRAPERASEGFPL